MLRLYAAVRLGLLEPKKLFCALSLISTVFACCPCSVTAAGLSTNADGRASTAEQDLVYALKGNVCSHDM